jgi:hypothetical protein
MSDSAFDGSLTSGGGRTAGMDNSNSNCSISLARANNFHPNPSISCETDKPSAAILGTRDRQRPLVYLNSTDAEHQQFVADNSFQPTTRYRASKFSTCGEIFSTQTVHRWRLIRRRCFWCLTKDCQIKAQSSQSPALNTRSCTSQFNTVKAINCLQVVRLGVCAASIVIMSMLKNSAIPVDVMDRCCIQRRPNQD